MKDRTGISAVYLRYIRSQPQHAPKPEPMTVTDVLRGVWHAYLWGLGILAVLALPALLDPLSYVTFVVLAALVGLFLTVPAGFLALSLYAIFRAVLGRVRWWVAPLACTLILGSCFAYLAGTPLGGFWGLILGPIAGYAFWDGAVGRAPPSPICAGTA